MKLFLILNNIDEKYPFNCYLILILAKLNLFMRNISFWDVYDFYLLERRQRERPDLPLTESEIRRYHEFTRNYKPPTLEEFFKLAKDLCEDFDFRVDEEAQCSRDNVIELQMEIDRLTNPWEEDERPEYYI